MDEAAIPGQAQIDAVRTLARAARALADDRAIGTEHLLACYRAARPDGHAAAAADEIDAAVVARVRALGGDALLAASRLRVVPALWRAPWRLVGADDGALLLHAPPREDLAGEALVLAAGLSLEAAKLAHGLPARPEALRGAFATPAAARSALAALQAGGGAREVELDPLDARVDAGALAALVGDRPCYVVAGDGAARAHDLLSPFARRLRAQLAALGERVEPRPPRDEAVYLGMAGLFAADPEVLAERLAVERADALVPVGPGAIAVRCEALPDGEVDRRCREAASQLKRARALLVLVEPCRSALAAALATLGQAVRAVAVVTTGTSDAVPDTLQDAASAHVAPIDNALLEDARRATPPLVSLPTLALACGAPDRDTDAFSLVQAVLRARAGGALDRRVHLLVRSAPAGNEAALSSACLEVLARFAPRQRARARRR